MAYGRAQWYELTRRLVTRMDLLPHLEMIHFQKIGFLGKTYSRLVRIDKLEKVELQSVEE